ncbi:MAG: DUF6206 family protein [Anaerolineales bacterium]|jgi:hypothetical protein
MNAQSMLSMHSPPGYQVNFDILQKFEQCLDTLQPEANPVPCKIRGYGEISTVIEIQEKGMQGLVFKRISIFETPDEICSYLDIYLDYNRLLEEKAGINLPAHGHAALLNPDGRPVFYIIQESVPAFSIGNQLLRLLPAEDGVMLVMCVLRELHKVWQFNANQTTYEIGLDGQISNWALREFGGTDAHLQEPIHLVYIDTSTPLFRIQRQEQMDAEMHLRSAPSFMAWILKVFFLEEVVNRYYDFRKVIIDLLANLYKEQKDDLMPILLPKVNAFLDEEAASLNIPPIALKELQDYYREDALIWSLYLSMRQFDRFLHARILRHGYPYILPGKISR